MAEKKNKKQTAKTTAKRTVVTKKSDKTVKAKSKPAVKPAAKKATVKAAKPATKKPIKKATATPKSAAKASKQIKAVKSSSKKQTAKSTLKQPKRTAPKPEAKKGKAKNAKALKPDWDFENDTSSDNKIIVINGKKAKKQKTTGRKQLKSVAKVGGYTAWDGRTGKTFATEKEAREYAIDFFIRTGELIPVTYTQRNVSHTFKAESKTEK